MKAIDRALETVATSAATALLSPLVAELVEYLTGKSESLPAWVTTLPATLQSRIAIESLKARNELERARGG